MEKRFDVIAMGELLIDFTMNGQSEQGNNLFEACPGGAPCNVLAMLNKLFNGGTNRTALFNIMPAKNASKPNGLLIICFRNSTGSSDLQLKPCHKRDIQSVANAIVMPR